MKEEEQMLNVRAELRGFLRAMALDESMELNYSTIAMKYVCILAMKLFELEWGEPREI